MYEVIPGAKRLDQWLAEHGQGLDLLDRLDLVQQLAEILRVAHRRGIFHRSLSPRSVLVVDNGTDHHFRIRDWQTATRPEPTDLLAVPTVQLVRGAGIGASTRAEVRLLAQRLRDAGARRRDGTPLTNDITLTPAALATNMPEIDGVRIPVITQTQWSRIPSQWPAERQTGEAA